MQLPNYRKPLNAAGNALAIGLVIVVLTLVGGAGYFVLHKSKVTTATTNPNACVSKTFTTGASGTCVSDIQNLLNWQLYGIDEPNYMKVDGQYDATLTNAVSKFQTQSKLSSTGQTGAPEWKLLCQSEDPPSWWTAAAKDAGC